MSIKLTFEIMFHSDYHVSDGQRFGLAVDSALLRDHNQSPLLRGTALAGLMLDGFLDLQTLVAQSSVQAKPSLNDAQTRLFGSAESPKEWRFSSTSVLPEANGRWGSEDVWRVRINPRTRRAEPQKLFLQEKGNGSLRFIFTATCQEELDANRADAALLVAAASMVRHLGSGRRRGQGQCELKLVDTQNFMQAPQEGSLHDAALDAFQSYWLEGGVLPLAPEKETKPVVDDGGQAKRFRIIAHLTEPVIVAKKSQVANAFETLHTIPGTVLLGALANRVAKRTHIGENPTAHKQFIEMFSRGVVSVTGLLPAAGSPLLYPSVAAPKSWAQCELNPQFATETAVKTHPLYDLSLADPERCTPGDCDSKLKPVTGFINLAGKREFHALKTREEIHTRMNKKTGRVNEGDLFTYEMIQAGQWFLGELTCSAGFWTVLQKNSGLRAGEAFPVRLGKATRRGYGLTHLYLEELDAASPSTWTLLDLADRLDPRQQENSREMTMLFLTDTILTDDWGCAIHGIEQKTLAKLLKIDATQISEVEAFVDSRGVDSFNTYRRMPRWRDEAITAGSMVRFTLSKLTDEEIVKALQSVETEGLGLRRQEGFGVVAFNHPVFLDDPKIDGIPLGNVADALKKLADTNKDVIAAANTIHEELKFATGKWRETLDTSWLVNKSMWESLDDRYEALARLIYLYRYRPVTELLAWFDSENGRSLGKEANLWGTRTLVGRDKQAKLDQTVVDVVVALLKQLKDKSQTKQTVGITMLAERLGEQLQENRQRRQDNQEKEEAHA